VWTHFILNCFEIKEIHWTGMITLSLVLNIATLVPVCLIFYSSPKRINKVAGIPTPARGILLAIYFTIVVASVVLLFWNKPDFVFALLSVQIIYKLISPFTVGTLRNPIVISNLLIAVVHSFTVYNIYQTGIITWCTAPNSLLRINLRT